MVLFKYIFVLSVLLLISSCVTMFVPETDENQDLIVVEGMITNQPGINTIKLSRSMPLGKRTNAVPLIGCSVIIKDDLENIYYLNESSPGIYETDSSEFCGIIGRKYTLKIFTNSNSSINYSYQSYPMEMIAVPPIDSLFYIRETIEEESEGIQLKEGCQIYLSTYGEAINCKYYKFDYTETWEIMLPFDVPNRVCWVNNNSSELILKNTSIFLENRIDRLPVKFISNETDRLNIKYSILVNQYSLNEEEYVYWGKIQNITRDVGNLYDIVPSSVANNIYCIENPGEEVLGFFTVSAKASKRIFIKERFSGQADRYSDEICHPQRVSATGPIKYLGESLWIIIDGSLMRPPYLILTDNRNCADCTTRGSNVKPLFWNDDE